MKIDVIRIPGTSKSKPCFEILKDGVKVAEETIAGRQDVQPAFLRVVARVKAEFQVTLHPAGRDQEKHMIWISEAPAPKTVKETPKVSTELLSKGIKAAQSPNPTINRATPKS